jgi:mono/diheme cytochrome c family protein
VKNGCAGCHQFPSGGAAGPGANLSNGSPMFGTDQKGLQDWISHKAADSGTGMPAFGKTNTPEEIAEIAQVIASLKAGQPVPLQK